MREDQLRHQPTHLRSQNRTPHITQNAFKKRERVNKENNHLLIEKKGVEEFLLRQNKAKNCIETLEARKKNAYGEKWNLKKCQFSYLH